MKTDLVLTMNEYLNEASVVPKRISPPAADARHIPIAEADDLRSDKGPHMCRCDRWGHPFPDGIERKPETRVASPKFPLVKE
jgi:hypothetical protein